MASSKNLLIITCFISLTLVSAHEICRDFTSYKTIDNSYCSAYSGRTCCSADLDSKNQAEVSGLQISDSTCADYIKNVSCSKCDPWGAHLFGSEATINTSVDPSVFAMPSLCRPYCEQFYAACADVRMNFQPGQSPWSASKMRDTYQTVDAFCNRFSVQSTDTSCFSGGVYAPPPEVPPPSGSEQICVETFKAGIDTNWFIAMEDPKDGTDRLFFAHKNGSIVLMKKSNGDYLGTMINFENIVNDAEAGLVGFTLHPQFKSNGRFYVYRSCPSDVCMVTCNTDADCNAAVSCTNGYCAGDHVDVLEELISVPTETLPPILSRRTLLMQAKPTRIHNSGCLMFGPHDGMLYFTMGDGGPFFDPHQTAQDLTKWLGKLLRIDVEGSSAEKPYRIPSDNPFVNRAGARPEIYAYGFRNPWRFTFDPLRPSYLFLADVGASAYEEVNLVVPGGNYGWSGFEGFDNSTLYTGIPVLNPIFPILGYTHAEIGGGPAIIGGKVYRGTQDPCKYGAYFYADWQPSHQWIARETRPGSGKFYSQSLQLTCAADSLPGCRALTQDSQPTFAVDSENRIYWIAAKLILRMADPQRCGLPTDCTLPPTQAPTTIAPSTQPPTTSAQATTQEPTTPLVSTTIAPATQASTTKAPITAPAFTIPTEAQEPNPDVPSTMPTQPEESGAEVLKALSILALVALLQLLYSL